MAKKMEIKYFNQGYELATLKPDLAMKLFESQKDNKRLSVQYFNQGIMQYAQEKKQEAQKQNDANHDFQDRNHDR